MGTNYRDELPWKYYHNQSNWDKDCVAYKPSINTFDYSALLFEKRYPRFERLRLSSPTPKVDLKSLRRSTRSFDPQKKITEAELYWLIEPLFPKCFNEEVHLLYSSAGGFYAVETYLYSNNVQGLEKSCFYHVLKKENSIERLWNAPNFLEFTFKDQGWVNDCALLIILTLNMTPYHNKYGDRGYRFGLIEVGSIIQLLTTSKGGKVLPSCVLGGYDDYAILDALDLSTNSDEQPVCCIAFGGII